MRYRYWLTVISMCLLLQTQAQRYQFKTYSLADGVPQSQVFDIMNDSRGFLWLGTRGGGIARFDGRNFRNFQTVDGLINNFVNCLYEDKAGQIWVGTQSGISVYNGRRFHNFRLSDTADVRVFAITQNDSSMWFGTSDGLYRMINQHLQKVDVPIPAVSLYITSFWCTSTSIFASSNHGLIELSRAEHAFKKVWTKRNGLSDNYIQCILPLGDSAAWLGTYGKGINKFDQGTISPVNIPDLPPNLIVYDLVHDENKNLWIASQQHGLFRWNETTGEVQQFTERSGLSNQHVRSVTTDRWGSLWIGTSGGGMNQFTGQLFTHFTRADGLSDNYVYAIGQDLNGTYWLGNGNKGLTHMLPGEMVNYTDSIWKNLKIKSMAQTKDSVWYFGTEGQGLLIKDTSGWHTFDRDDGLCGNYIKDIEIDSSGILFVATLDGGVSAIYPGTTPRIRNYQYRTSLPSNRVYTLHADKSGNCWFGTENKGFGRFQNGKVTMTRSGQDLAYQSVRAIRSDKRNSIWLATSNGLYHYKPTEDTLIRINPRLMQSTNLYLLEFDLNGQLYVGHERGLDVLTLNESGEVIEVERFGAQEGFRGIETCQNAALCDRDGMLWFGTINGLTRYNPNRTERRSLPPSVYLESVDLFYEQLDSGRFGYQPTFWDQMASIPVFPYDQNHFGFSLNGIHLTEPGRLNYQWKLVGYDTGWTPVSPRRDATYSNLPPGQYTFEYRAVLDADQELMSEPHSWSFEIAAPFWKRPWFRITVGLIILLLVTGGLALYFRRLREQREQLELRNELLELEQKALRLQMNPHFLFNALNSIQSLVARNNNAEARTYLQRFASLMRKTLESSRSDRISLNDEIQILDNYLSLEQLSRTPAFTFLISTDDHLDRDEVSIPPMMIQPFVENAVKHGVASVGDSGHITVHFELQNDWLKCTVEDNGIGREASETRKSNKAKTHESAAIQVITDRLAILNREFPGHALRIEDVHTEGNTSGTRVILMLHAW